MGKMHSTNSSFVGFAEKKDFKPALSNNAGNLFFSKDYETTLKLIVNEHTKISILLKLLEHQASKRSFSDQIEDTFMLVKKHQVSCRQSTLQILKRTSDQQISHYFDYSKKGGYMVTYSINQSLRKKSQKNWAFLQIDQKIRHLVSLYNKAIIIGPRCNSFAMTQSAGLMAECQMLLNNLLTKLNF